jgi:hypothetical protein
MVDVRTYALCTCRKCPRALHPLTCGSCPAFSTAAGGQRQLQVVTTRISCRNERKEPRGLQGSCSMFSPCWGPRWRVSSARERHGHGGALPFDTLHRHLARVRGRNLLHNIQAQPGLPGFVVYSGSKVVASCMAGMPIPVSRTWSCRWVPVSWPFSRRCHRIAQWHPKAWISLRLLCGRDDDHTAWINGQSRRKRVQSKYSNILFSCSL